MKSRTVKAEYDATAKVLRLVEPLEGIPDHETVDVLVTTESVPQRSILEFRGCLSPEAGESLARAVEEMFPTEK